MAQDTLGNVISGPGDAIARSFDLWRSQRVDWDLLAESPRSFPAKQRTIARPVSVTGSGTFLGKASRTLRFEPTGLKGWWFSREDVEDALPVKVSVRNVWTTGDIVSNIVLRSGPPSNYIRMVEHMIALRLGMNIDNLMIRLESGDPPLFDRGSLDLVDALESAGSVETGDAEYFTVREPVTVGTAGGSFVTLHPCEARQPELTLDCAIDFPTAIGKQRIRFPVTPENFRRGAEARTNTSFVKMLYCRTVGKVFADIRHLGYSMDNILVASRWGYINKPRLVRDGKALEAVWHRAALDLLAALALVEEGRFVGHVISYKAGHALDCRAVRLLYKRDLLVRWAPSGEGHRPAAEDGREHLRTAPTDSGPTVATA
jgi:UDP-3-O-acyl-N-acetylglucosamine deacetylase